MFAAFPLADDSSHRQSRQQGPSGGPNDRPSDDPFAGLGSDGDHPRVTRIGGADDPLDFMPPLLANFGVTKG